MYAASSNDATTRTTCVALKTAVAQASVHCITASDHNVFGVAVDLSDVEAGGETLFPLLHPADTTPPFLDNEAANLRRVSAFLDKKGRVTDEQSEHSSYLT